MSRPLDPLWTLLREAGAGPLTQATWQSELGEAYEHSAGWLRIARGRSKSWLCGVPGGGCLRRVVEHAPDDIVAVCGDWPPRCDRVVLERTQLARHTLAMALLAKTLVETSGLPDAPVQAAERGVVVGPIPLGLRRLHLLITLAHDPLRLMQATSVLRERHPDDLLVLLGPFDQPPPDILGHFLTGLRIDRLSLREVFAVGEHGPVADLSRWVLQHAAELASFDPLPVLHGHRLVLDPARDRVAVEGAWLDCRRLRLPLRLLLGLAKRPGELVTRDELFDEVWPGGDPSKQSAWEVNLRDVKRRLTRKIPASLVEQVDGDAFTGGYRLQVEPSQVAWWTSIPE